MVSWADHGSILAVVSDLAFSRLVFERFLTRVVIDGSRYDNNGTFTFTRTCGASATFTFNGTALWIFGAKRKSHGLYNITLDGSVYTDDGFYDGDLFQQVLFSAGDLDGTIPHTVSITNWLTDRTKPYLNVDSVSASMVRSKRSVER